VAALKNGIGVILARGSAQDGDGKVEADFTYDLMRSLYLSRIIQHFGIPDERKVLSGDAGRVEVYRFPGDDIYRFATYGLSEVQRRLGSKTGMELMFVLPATRVNESNVSDQSYAYLIRLSQKMLDQGCSVDVPSVFPPDPDGPWAMKATMLDEPRGESEDLLEIRLGRISIRPVWAIPISEGEWAMAEREGIEALDAAFENGSVELIDIHRASVAP
jgi:hypothetical protein